MECFNKACVLNINNCCGLKDVYISESGVCGKILILEEEEMEVLERKYSFYKEAERILPEKKEKAKSDDIKEAYYTVLPSGEELTKSELHRMYIKEGKPSRLIADLLGVNESIIKRFIREWKLTRNANKGGEATVEKEETVQSPTKRYREI